MKTSLVFITILSIVISVSLLFRTFKIKNQSISQNQHQFALLEELSNYCLVAKMQRKSVLERIEVGDKYKIEYDSDSIIILKYEGNNIDNFFGFELTSNDSLITSMGLFKP